ncbi:Thermostable monoacylglycerol lipase [Rubrobacter xylanophilus DSM 9941]|uniref:alpha/beta hydrolase n=1 Tax=Rubrobacter xylanophilus TaxID=49319 RepID=UPI001C63E519|nr:alpha/beta fold hydrolase [Rubrobacter xylanophilus]QYJ15011.1 Thermostable monoacylglycerol lipase [Rubrobacter xylanophilus DSM 9941]
MSEARVMEGAEPFYAEGGRAGVLVSHGYTGSPQSMRPLAEGLAERGFTVALPRLRGHGTTPEEMAAATAADWVADIEGAASWLRERCEVLFMAGLSMGGTLTLYMAGRHPEMFAGIVPINAAVFVNNPDLASLAFAEDAPVEVPGVGNDIKASGVTELAYPVVPVPTIKELFVLMKAAEELLPRIVCPMLAVVSREDHVVPPANTEYIAGRVASAEREVLWLEDSYHVATLDNDADLILRRAAEFFERHAKAARGG